jgi:hypothetical protein
MDLDKLNKWLILVVNLGVLAGVLLLAVEIRQNQEIMERDQEIALLDASHLDVSRFTDWRAKFINDKATAQLFLDGLEGKELDEADQFRFGALCNDLFWAAALMYERSVELGRPVYAKATIHWMRETVSQPAIKTCWEDMKGVYLLWGYDEFVSAVDQL